MRSAANRDRRERRAQEHAERREGWHARWHARWDAKREARRDAAWNAGGHLSGYPEDGRSRRSLRRERHEEYHRLGGPSFAKRLLGAFIVAWLLSMVLAGGLLQTMSSWHPAVAVAHWLDGQSTFIDKHLRFDAAGRPVALVESDDTAWAHGAAPRDWKYRVVDERGVVLLGSDPGAPPLAPAGRAFDRADGSFDIVQDGVLLHVATKAFAHGGHAPYFIQTAVSERSAALFRGSLVRPILQNAAGIAVIALVLFGVGVHFMLRRVLRPLREASAAASRIDPRNIEMRLSAESMPREMRPLIEAFNEALGRLETGYRVQQEFLASAAHELKTPLALMRGQVELSESEDRDLLLHDIDVMARQVHQLLHLAEVSEVGNYEFEPVDVGTVAGEAVAFLQRLAQRATVHLDLRMPDAAASVDADRSAVFVLVKNLVENAIQHSPRGAVVTIAVGARGIVVRDEGAGIAPEHLGELFKRFWRGPARRDSGAGLGLAICFEIATAHGWTLAARNAACGAEFDVAFGPP